MPTSGVSSLGSRIREERLRRGVSLRGLARDVGVSASMISQIETGKTRPSVSTLYAITSALGVSIEEVFAPATEDSAEPGPRPRRWPPRRRRAGRHRRPVSKRRSRRWAPAGWARWFSRPTGRS